MKEIEIEKTQVKCEECKHREATTKYSNMKVCEYCSTKLNDYFDDEYR